MKVFVRHKSTGLFYAGEQLWHRDAAKAIVFESGPAALQIASALSEPVEIVCAFDNNVMGSSFPYLPHRASQPEQNDPP